MDSSDSNNTVVNTTFELSSDINPGLNTTLGLPSDTSSSWKNNLSKRWSKKQPTKSELCDTFLDMKNSLIVQSNNAVCLNTRVENLEKDLADLIRYINEHI